ncbi:MAG: hypothetical protein GY858_08735 [Candidatus Omnitrophica bacterium]|nr:hypothetical protein [Candidatus Omnitrophota bacterium]
MRDDMDMLREVSSIAAAHGSRALSEMLGKRINLTMPNIETVDPKKLKQQIDDARLVISVGSKILSGITGSVVLVLDEKSAFELVDMCCGDSGKETNGLLTEIGVSAIKEIGNVVMGSFAGALSVFLQNPVIPSIPTLTSGPLQDILRSVTCLYDGDEYVVMIEACFEESERKVKGGLYFAIPPKTMEIFQAACKKMLDDI